MPYVPKGCKYACTDPVTCPYLHPSCRHCKKVREEAAKPKEAQPEAILSDTKSYLQRHPLP